MPIAPKELLVHEDKIMELWMEVLENHNNYIADNMNEEDVGVEEHEFKLEPGELQGRKIRFMSLLSMQRCNL